MDTVSESAISSMTAKFPDFKFHAEERDYGHEMIICGIDPAKRRFAVSYPVGVQKCPDSLSQKRYRRGTSRCKKCGYKIDSHTMRDRTDEEKKYILDSLVSTLTDWAKNETEPDFTEIVKRQMARIDKNKAYGNQHVL
jgi:hypothetical protein